MNWKKSNCNTLVNIIDITSLINRSNIVSTVTIIYHLGLSFLLDCFINRQSLLKYISNMCVNIK